MARLPPHGSQTARLLKRSHCTVGRWARWSWASTGTSTTTRSSMRRCASARTRGATSSRPTWTPRRTSPTRRSGPATAPWSAPSRVRVRGEMRRCRRAGRCQGASQAACSRALLRIPLCRSLDAPLVKRMPAHAARSACTAACSPLSHPGGSASEGDAPLQARGRSQGVHRRPHAAVRRRGPCAFVCM